jgi:hypothetical protein
MSGSLAHTKSIAHARSQDRDMTGRLDDPVENRGGSIHLEGPSPSLRLYKRHGCTDVPDPLIVVCHPADRNTVRQSVRCKGREDLLARKHFNAALLFLSKARSCMQQQSLHARVPSLRRPF